MHLNFTVELMEMQIAGNRYFLYEHPEWASSWNIEAIQRLMAYLEVQRARADQCQYNLEAQRGKWTCHSVMKPTGFLSNSAALLKELEAVPRTQGQVRQRKGACPMLR